MNSRKWVDVTQPLAIQCRPGQAVSSPCLPQRSLLLARKSATPSAPSHWGSSLPCAGDLGFPGSSGPRGDPGFKGDKGDVGLPGKPGSMDKVDMGSMKGQKGDQGEKGNLGEGSNTGSRRVCLTGGT